MLEGKSMRLGRCEGCAERAVVEVCELLEGRVGSRRYCDACAAKAGVGVKRGRR